MAPIIFSGWMGPGPMSENRQAALLSLIRNSGSANAHVTKETLQYWFHPSFPAHPAFRFLSAVHQCDYLRCYLLHVYGGGYADVKPTVTNWRPFFSQLQRSSHFGIGYTEVGPEGVARVGGDLEMDMQKNYQRLIGLCAMIFKPQTDFTKSWFESVHDMLDANEQALAAYPARHPQDHIGAKFSNGYVSQYPLKWTGLGGDIFHPLVFKYSDRILHGSFAPLFSNYR
jgi:hypothetical protein